MPNSSIGQSMYINLQGSASSSINTSGPNLPQSLNLDVSGGNKTNFFKNIAGQVGGFLGNANNINMLAGIGLGISSAFGVEQRDYNSTITGLKNINLGIMDKVNPMAGAVNRLSDVGSGAIAGIFGKSTNYSDKASQGFDSATDLLNYFGPWGMAANFALDTINGLTGTTVKGVLQSERVGRSSSYGSVSSDMAANAGDATVGGFGRLSGKDSKLKNKRALIQDRVNRTENILNKADDRTLAALYDGYNLRHLIDVQGGYQLKYNRIGRQGMKLPTKSDITKVRDILSKKSGGILIKEPEYYSIEAEFEENEILEFKEGGTIIPEGALHARKNNMKGAGKDFTHKGIPVVDNSGEQQAEIECNEIIFSLEVTKRLEQLMEDGSDKAAIAAGKLLVKEIFENTEDRTGLISSIIGEDSEGDDIEELSKLEEGGTVEIAKEAPKKRKYDTPWKFMNYLNSSRGGLNDDYDYESFYNNEDAYFKWEDEEESNPGKAHMSGDFKKPNHITYSDEGFGWKGSDELGWTFTVSPRLQSLRSYEDYIKYWDANEPESTLIYGDKTYKVKK